MTTVPVSLLISAYPTLYGSLDENGTGDTPPPLTGFDAMAPRQHRRKQPINQERRFVAENVVKSYILNGLETACG